MMQEQNEVPAATPRSETVDLLRGLSILAVVLLHCWIRFIGIGVRMGTGLPEWSRYLLLHSGGNGVTVFFAISGFLITLTSMRRVGGRLRGEPAASTAFASLVSHPC